MANGTEITNLIRKGEALAHHMIHSRTHDELDQATVASLVAALSTVTAERDAAETARRDAQVKADSYDDLHRRHIAMEQRAIDAEDALAEMKAERDAAVKGRQDMHRRAQRAEGAVASTDYWVSAMERTLQSHPANLWVRWAFGQIRKSLSRAALHVSETPESEHEAQDVSTDVHTAHTLATGDVIDRAAGSFQSRVLPWLHACFGEVIASDKVERNHRFLEEALELVQSGGCTVSEAHQLVDYVYGRPVGEMAQEVGGVMNTLAALCLAHGLDMDEAAEIELARVWTKVDAIRAKQAAKPKHSPLPAAAPAHDAESLRAEVERLTAERDDAMALFHASDKSKRKVVAERDATLARVAELEAAGQSLVAIHDASMRDLLDPGAHDSHPDSDEMAELRKIVVAPPHQCSRADLCIPRAGHEAAVAAAYEAAARRFDVAGGFDGRAYAYEIRALTPADARASLDRMLAEARVEGMRDAAGMLKDAADDWRLDGHEHEAQKIEDEMKLILVAVDLLSPKPVDDRIGVKNAT